ncbi:DNA polymerase zeta [Coniosporium tulheliwenetii]|uniref:DNA polymerase zeta n=1 Tax=Coniosporium tulheliwenetii TaxID=3383036 RepID=A0ACC2Z1A0_9PEZI|nr:DNA polymerase zeta [Cladosporium sp. JES 115]
MDTFRFRLNCIDHYQANPTELDPPLQRSSGPPQRHNGPQVPVIRVFGATETGQKVCAHIHGAFPYLYLQYDGDLSAEAVDAYIHNLRLSIEHALATSYRRNPYDGRSTFVAHISLVKGVPYYGYHVGYKFFLKVYIFNPLHMTRLADLLHQGAILNRPLQPYESHLQYLLQWMCDYNLYGCAYIDCEKVKFRGPVPDWSEISSTAHKWHDQSIQPEWVSEAEQFPRQSHCSIEVDVCVRDIMNRQEIQPRPLHHDFVERLSPLAPDERLVHSMAGLWRDETVRRKRRMGMTDPSSSPFPPEVLLSMSADPRNTEKGGWIHEEEFRAMVQGLIQEERTKIGDSKIGFDDFVRPASVEDRIQTALESVEDLFPEKLRDSQATQAAIDDEFHDEGIGGEEPTMIEDSLPRLASDDVPYDSDEDTAREIALTQKTRKSVHVEEKQSSGETIEYDDELRPDGENYGEQFRDPEDPVNPVANGPAGQAENPEKIRHELDHYEKLMARSAKPLPTGSTHTVSKRSSELEDSSPSKRRKVSHFGALQIPETQSRCVGSPKQARSPLARQVEFDDGVTDADLLGLSSQKSNGDGFGMLSQSSQRSIKAHGSKGPNTLSFPVVKKTNDTDESLRLSQRAGFSNSQKSPQKSPKTPAPKSASFDTPKTDSPVTSWTDQRLTSTSTSDDEPKHSTEAVCLAANMAYAFDDASTHGGRVLCYGSLPPSAQTVELTMLELGLPPVIYQDAYYSDEKDVPDRPREYAAREFKLESTTVPYLPPFDPTGTSPASFGEKLPIIVDKAKEELGHRRRRKQCTLRNWEIAAPPPTYAEVEEWLRNEREEKPTAGKGEVDHELIAQPLTRPRPPPELSQIDGPTQKNKHGFRDSQKQKSSVQHVMQYMSIMSLEVHVNTRGTLIPDPEHDEISCVFWCVQSDDDAHENDGRPHIGILALSPEDGVAKKIARQVSIEVEHEEDELDLINRVVDIVHSFDPDILTGYEVHNGSWGYMIERARVKYEYNLCDEFSRMKSQLHGRFGKEADRWGFNHTSTIRVTGRHMINIWRAMRSELNLLQYTMENVVLHLLHRRIPHYSFQDLTAWYKSSKPRDLAKAIDYFTTRVQLNLDILEANELVSRTSEQARLLGIDFFSVFSRGSQFKVESLMFRIAKPENFILISPSRKQVGQQNALECLPLVMEPQSAFYTSPVLVLDFQSLYPSVMIAYNYCYSTCLGRITSWRGQNKFGFTDLKREPGLLELVKDSINIAPNGMMYVKPPLRKSLLAKMLGEILETRVMVKSGMKEDRDDGPLQQLLNNRQLALKLIANVTYGYTSASFSGRMPCAEIADSIVQTGRETLERAIALIHSVPEWGAEVVYGDTDSLFVHLKGRTKDQAFAIGQEIAKAVTNTNPRPVKLKFEKVYLPCVLLAKKRYVGFKYETLTQQEPDFDAKGIETVRRDGTPAEQKIEERCLKLLFRTADLSAVKRYFQKQCAKIMHGRISIQDFLFAKEVKLGTYSDRGPPPPGALIATKRMLEDRRAEPQYGERVPYVVVTGAPGARLIDRCVAPEVLLGDEQVELDAEYYIAKNIIPPLERIFNLVGANVRQWYDEMPKVQRIRQLSSLPAGAYARDGTGNALVGGPGVGQTKKTLENYLKSSLCVVCRAKLPPPPPNRFMAVAPPPPLPLCEKCSAAPGRALLALRTGLQLKEERARNVDLVCRRCSGLAFGEEVRCDSRDCPVFYTRLKERAALGALRAGVGSVIEALEEEEGVRQRFEW